ncbi:MAG: molybdopterin adenylyltransferase [Deltaproteobacteria bacterium]|nr:molybdopterin adenylyltransferase [Deltaproteobacteria bacterium]
MTAPIRIGVVTTSDRAAAGVYVDEGTPEVVGVLRELLLTEFEAVTRLVPDEQPLIEQRIKDLVDVDGCCLVVTTGGTGPALRDVTVEATLAVGHKHLPGFGELMRAVSLTKVPTAILSRQEATLRFRDDGVGCLIVNLPGSIKAIRECLLAVMPAIPYCLELAGGPSLETNESIVKAFRPKKK